MNLINIIIDSQDRGLYPEDNKSNQNWLNKDDNVDLVENNPYGHSPKPGPGRPTAYIIKL